MSRSNLSNSEEVGVLNRLPDEEWDANQSVLYMSSYADLDEARSDSQNNGTAKEEHVILLIDENINENVPGLEEDEEEIIFLVEGNYIYDVMYESFVSWNF